MVPDRVIRDELLHSERYWSVSIEAQRLYVHLLLNVDDLARFSGKNYTIRTACYPGQAVDPEKIERMLAELIDVDLVRVYHVTQNDVRHDAHHDRFIFIPRFKQRLRFTKSRYPAPPNEINDIEEKKTDLSQTQDSLKSDSSRQKRREEKRREEKNTRAFALDARFQKFWEAYPRKVAKHAAQKMWLRLDPDEQLFAAILQAIERAMTLGCWRRDQQQFIPHASTWLSQRRWEDALDVNVAAPVLRSIV